MCDRQSLICYVNRGMTFSTCELSRLNTSYSYCVSTSSLLYRMFTSTTLLLRMIFNAPFTSAFRTCPLAVLYCPRFILFPLKWYFSVSSLLYTGMTSLSQKLDYVGILLKCFIISHNKSSNIMIDTVINHPACSLIHVVISAVFI